MKAVVVAVKTQSVIKRMCLLALEVGRQRQLVVAALRRLTLAAARLLLASTGASVTQIPCRHGTHTIPPQMPNIRLQALP